MSRTIDIESMQTSALFERVSGARVKDCIKRENEFFFIIMPGSMSRAIGKGGVTIKKISALLKKPVFLIEFNENPALFLTNAISSQDVQVSKEGEGLIISCKDARVKGQIFGREKERFHFLQELVQRYFPKLTLKVV